MKFLNLLLFILALSSATISNSQMVKSKDGVSLGDRKIFIQTCTQGAENQKMNVKGIEIEAEKYCACVCDNLIPTINSWEMEEAVKSGKLMELFLEEKNLEILMECVEGNIEVKEEYEFGSSEHTELQKELGIKMCVKEAMADEEYEDLWTEEMAKQYCSCAIDKLYSAGYTYKDLLEVEDENSQSFNEIIMPCVTEILQNNEEFQPSNTYNASDVIGGGPVSKIPLVDYMSYGYKVKITIGGISKYFLFDTGASDLVIDEKFAKELLKNKSLKKENYEEKTEFETANKEVIEGQMVRIDNIVIGDYTVNNVSIAIIKNGSLLCGMSFLDKFKRWEIDKENKELIIYK